MLGRHLVNASGEDNLLEEIICFDGLEI